MPLLASFGVVQLLPFLDGVRPGLPMVAVLGGTAAVVAVGIALHGPVRVWAARIAGVLGGGRRVLEELVALVVMTLLVWPFMADVSSAVIASLAANAIYQCIEPWMHSLERRRPGGSSGADSVVESRG